MAWLHRVLDDRSTQDQDRAVGVTDFPSDFYYDRAGLPIPFDEWARLRSLPDYFRIAEDTIGNYWISTVWVGLVMNLTWTNAPIIFETMVFEGDADGHDLDMLRYATEEEARQGHAEMVTLVRATAQPDPNLEDSADQPVGRSCGPSAPATGRSGELPPGQR